MNLQKTTFVQRENEIILAVLTSVELIASAPLANANECGVPWAIYKAPHTREKNIDVMYIEYHHGFPNYEIHNCKNEFHP